MGRAYLRFECGERIQNDIIKVPSTFEKYEQFICTEASIGHKSHSSYLKESFRMLLLPPQFNCNDIIL